MTQNAIRTVPERSAHILGRRHVVLLESFVGLPGGGTLRARALGKPLIRPIPQRSIEFNPNVPLRCRNVAKEMAFNGARSAVRQLMVSSLHGIADQFQHRNFMTK